jgi:hypothetical protein
LCSRISLQALLHMWPHFTRKKLTRIERNIENQPKYPLPSSWTRSSSTTHRTAMATFLGSSPALLARPIAKPHISCAQTPRPPSAQNQPPSSEQPQAQTQQQSVQAQPQQATARPKRAGGADSTDWVASSLTRRFGIGAGLAWAGFLAVGVVSEQLKTRFEVAQQQANTKSVPFITMLARGSLVHPATKPP